MGLLERLDSNITEEQIERKRRELDLLKKQIALDKEESRINKQINAIKSRKNRPVLTGLTDVMEKLGGAVVGGVTAAGKWVVNGDKKIAERNVKKARRKKRKRRSPQDDYYDDYEEYDHAPVKRLEPPRLPSLSEHPGVLGVD